MVEQRESREHVRGRLQCTGEEQQGAQQASTQGAAGLVSDVVVGPVAPLVCGWARISNMTGPADHVPASVVTVRYWAAARAAAGVDLDELTVTGESRSTRCCRGRRRHADQRFRDVMSTCSVLVGERPVGGHDPATVVVRPGETVELLPPFAGG